MFWIVEIKVHFGCDSLWEDELDFVPALVIESNREGRYLLHDLVSFLVKFFTWYRDDNFLGVALWTIVRGFDTDSDDSVLDFLEVEMDPGVFTMMLKTLVVWVSAVIQEIS